MVRFINKLITITKMNKENLDKDALNVLTGLGLTTEGILSAYPRVIEPLVKPSDLGFTRREFFYWTEKNVIDIPKEDERQSAWSRLNLIEVIWIKIAQELRLFNFPFAFLVQLKHALFKDMLKEYLNDRDMLLSQLESAFPDKSFVNSFLALLEEERNAEPDYDPMRAICTPLGAMLAEILLLNRKITMLLYKEGEQYMVAFEGYSLQKIDQAEIDKLKSKTHVTLFLNDLIADYLVEEKNERINKDFGFISDAELEIIEAIRDKEVKEIHIKKDDNEVLTYIATSKREIKDDQVAAIKRLLRMNEFDDVRVVLRNGKHLYIENKKKIKIRPDKTAQKTNKN